jgi:hemerythrin
MDADHAEAARLINAMAEADAAGRAPLLAHFIEHCREHFAREEAMMAETGFFATACHAGEHERVLDELAQVQAKLAAGDAQDGYFQRGLPEWLLNHRNTMDFVTAEHARGRGRV